MIKTTKRKVKKCPYCSGLRTIKYEIRKDIKRSVMDVNEKTWWNF